MKLASVKAAPLWIFLALMALYSVLGLFVLAPEAAYSGDIGVKFVQARALAAHHFTSLDIPYPGAFLDPSREFFPLRPPFVMTTGGATQAIFSPVSAVLQACAVLVAGFSGLALLSLLAGAVILLAASRLAAAPGEQTAVLVALGVASPLWFYAVSGWEHAPAVAFGTAAFACAMLAPGSRRWLAAGLLIGAGATLRDEVLLLLPGLLLIAWLATRQFRPIAETAAAAAAVLLASALMEVWWFGRPAAAHLRHAVHLLQSAIHLTHGRNPDVPGLESFTLHQRYETVIQYWLLGYGNDRLLLAFGLALAAAFAIRRRWRSSLGFLVWVLAIAAVAAVDVVELLTAPKWLAGLHRVSPYLVFALLPGVAIAGGDATVRRVRSGGLAAAVLCTTAIYLALALAGADTTGGKSLGPRLLLPLLPLLAVVAIARMADYSRAPGRCERWIGRVGWALVAMAAAMHLFGTIPAYYARNREDAAAIAAVAASRARVVVSDDVFTAQLLFPLYYRKIIFLTETQPWASRLGERLAEARLSEAIVVSRREVPMIQLPPFHLERTDQAGRMVIQYWRR